MPPSTRYERNWARRRISPLAAGAEDARSRADVISAVADAARRRMPIRAIAGAYSDTTALATRGLQIQVGGLLLPNGGRIREVESSRLESTARSVRWVEVSAGARVHDLNLYLAERGLALEMLGAFSGQTLIGAICTGTHGTRLPPLAAFVSSLEVVLARGRTGSQVFRLERPDLPVIRPSVGRREQARVIRNRELFEATVIASGAIGVITSMIVRVVPAFSLIESRRAMIWGDVERRLATCMFDERVYARSFLLNPYDGTSVRSIACVESVLEKDGDATGLAQRFGGAPECTDDLGKAVELAMASRRNIGAMLRQHAIRPPEPGQIERSYNDSWLLLTGPNELPAGVSVEYAFAPTIAARVIREMLTLLRRLFRRGICIIGSISVRGIGRFDAPLSPSDGGRRIAVEVLAALGNSERAMHRGDDALSELERIALEYGGRVHWGQRRPPVLSEATRLYPRYSEWVATRRRMDPSGLFLNEFPG